MSDFSRTLIERSGYRNDAFAELYDRYRPAPRPELLRVLALIAQIERPRVVVDLGAGTGLSTRAWAEHAERIVGVEANPHMLERARRATREPNVEYVEAYAAATGLDDVAADLVTCAQAFHWMEPEPVLLEAARLLRSGGVFAAYDYDLPLLVHPEVDDAFAAHLAARHAAWQRLGRAAGAAPWPKESHLDRIRASRGFRYAREVVCHGFDEADADRIVGLAETLGGPREVLGDAPDVAQTFERLREASARVVGARVRPMVVCYRARVGVK
jgi:ubiquinone/menaquinone biosynthesis C-methylase UbiE